MPLSVIVYSTFGGTTGKTTRDTNPMNQLLQNAQWHYSKKKAELIGESTTLIEMEFNRKATYVKIGKRKVAITTDGFWCPKIIVTSVA